MKHSKRWKGLAVLFATLMLAITGLAQAEVTTGSTSLTLGATQFDFATQMTNTESGDLAAVMMESPELLYYGSGGIYLISESGNLDNVETVATYDSGDSRWGAESGYGGIPGIAAGQLWGIYMDDATYAAFSIDDILYEGETPVAVTISYKYQSDRTTNVAGQISAQFAVSSTDPAMMEEEVSVRPTITVTFNQSLMAPLAENAVSITTSLGTDLTSSFAISVSENIITATYTNDADLSLEETIIVTVNSAVVSSSTEETLSEDYSFYFVTTIGSPASIDVSTTSPSNGASEISVTSGITISFTTDLDAVEFSDTLWSVVGSISGEINMAQSATTEGLTLTHVKGQQFTSGETVTVTLDNDLRGTNGATLGYEYSFSFTVETVAFSVVSTTPENSTTEIPPGTDIVINFSSAVNSELLGPTHATISSSIAGVINTENFSPSYTNGDQTLTLTQGESFDGFGLGAVVTVQLNADLPGVSGTLGTPYVFEFTISESSASEPIKGVATLENIGAGLLDGEWFDFSDQMVVTDVELGNAADITFTEEEGVNFSTVGGAAIAFLGTYGSLDEITEAPDRQDIDASWGSFSYEGTGNQPVSAGQVWAIYTQDEKYALLRVKSTESDTVLFFTFGYKYQSDGTRSFPVTPSSFSVDYTSPRSEATDVTNSIGIEVYFNGTADAGSFSSEMVTISTDQRGELSLENFDITMAGTGDVLNISQMSGFTFDDNETVTVTLSGSLPASDGSTLGNPYTFSFQIQGGTTDFSVVSTTPRRFDVSISPETNLIINFSSPVDPESLDPTHATISSSVSGTINTDNFTPSYSDGNQTLTLTQNTGFAGFESGAVITVQLNAELPGVSGTLGTPYTFSFTIMESSASEPLKGVASLKNIGTDYHDGEWFDFSSQMVVTDVELGSTADITFTENETVNFSTVGNASISYMGVYGSLNEITEAPDREDTGVSWVTESYNGTGYQPVSAGQVWAIYTQDEKYALLRVKSTESDTALFFTFGYKYQSDGTRSFPVTQSAFSVDYTSPRSEATDVTNSIGIEVYFNGGANPSTFSPDMINISTDQRGILSLESFDITMSGTGEVLTITTLTGSPFNDAEIVTVTLSGELPGADGSTLGSPYSFMFQVQGEPGPTEMVYGYAYLENGGELANDGYWLDFSTQNVSADATPPTSADIGFTENNGVNFFARSTGKILLLGSFGNINDITAVPVYKADDIAWQQSSYLAASGQPLQAGQAYAVYTLEGKYAVMFIQSVGEVNFEASYKYQPDGTTSLPAPPLCETCVMMPDLTGMSIEQALATLLDSGLVFDGMEIVSGTEPESWNTITATSQSAGTHIDTALAEGTSVSLTVAREPGSIIAEILQPEHRATLEPGDTVIVRYNKPVAMTESYYNEGTYESEVELQAWFVGQNSSTDGLQLIDHSPDYQTQYWVNSSLPTNEAYVLRAGSWHLTPVGGLGIAVSTGAPIPAAEIFGSVTTPPEVADYGTVMGEWGGSHVTFNPNWDVEYWESSPGNGVADLVYLNALDSYFVPAFEPGEYNGSVNAVLTNPANVNYKRLLFGSSNAVTISSGSNRVDLELGYGEIGLMQGEATLTPETSTNLVFATGGPSDGTVAPDIQLVDLGPLEYTLERTARTAYTEELPHEYNLAAGHLGVKFHYIGSYYSYDLGLRNEVPRIPTFPPRSTLTAWSATAKQAKGGMIYPDDIFAVSTPDGKYAVIAIEYGSTGNMFRTSRAERAARPSVFYGAMNVVWAYQPDGTTYFGPPPEGEVDMPDLSGLTLEEAQAALNRLGTFYIQTEYVASPIPELIGTIREQTPEAGETIWNEGSDVGVTIWAAPAEEISVLSVDPPDGTANVGALDEGYYTVSFTIALSSAVEMVEVQPGEEGYPDTGGNVVLARIARSARTALQEILEPVMMPNVQVMLLPEQRVHATHMTWNNEQAPDTIRVMAVVDSGYAYDYIINPRKTDGLGAEIPQNNVFAGTITTTPEWTGTDISGTVTMTNTDLPMNAVFLSPEMPLGGFVGEQRMDRAVLLQNSTYTIRGVEPGLYYAVGMAADFIDGDDAEQEIHSGYYDLNADGIADEILVEGQTELTSIDITLSRLSADELSAMSVSWVSPAPFETGVNTTTAIQIGFNQDIEYVEGEGVSVDAILLPPPVGAESVDLPPTAAQLNSDGDEVSWNVTLAENQTYQLFITDATSTNEHHLLYPELVTFTTGEALLNTFVSVDVVLPAGVLPSANGYVAALLNSPPESNDSNTWDIAFLGYSPSRMITIEGAPTGGYYIGVLPADGAALPGVHMVDGEPAQVVVAEDQPVEVSIAVKEGIGPGVLTVSPEPGQVNVPTETMIVITYRSEITIGDDGMPIDVMVFPEPLAAGPDSLSEDGLRVYKRVTLAADMAYQVVATDDRNSGVSPGMWVFSTGTALPEETVAGSVYPAYYGAGYEAIAAADSRPFIVGLVSEFPSTRRLTSNVSSLVRAAISSEGWFILPAVPAGEYFVVAEQQNVTDNYPDAPIGFAYLDADENGLPDKVTIAPGSSILGIDLPAKSASSSIYIAEASPGLFESNLAVGPDAMRFVFEGPIDTSNFGDISVYPTPVSGPIEDTDFEFEYDEGNNQWVGIVPDVQLAENTTYTMWFFDINVHPEATNGRFISPVSHVFTTASQMPTNRIVGSTILSELAADAGEDAPMFVTATAGPGIPKDLGGDQEMLALTWMNSEGDFRFAHLDDGSYYLTAFITRDVNENEELEVLDYGTYDGDFDGEADPVAISGGLTERVEIYIDSRLSSFDVTEITPEDGTVNYSPTETHSATVRFTEPVWSDGELTRIDSTDFNITPWIEQEGVFSRGDDDSTVVYSGFITGEGTFQFSVWAGDQMSYTVVTTASAMPTGSVSGFVGLATSVTTKPYNTLVVLLDSLPGENEDIWDADIVQYTQTISGEYVFENVPDGDYYVVAVAYFDDTNYLTSSLRTGRVNVSAGMPTEGVIRIIGGDGVTGEPPIVDFFDVTVVKVTGVTDLYLSLVQTSVIDVNGLEDLDSIKVTLPNGTVSTIDVDPEEPFYFEVVDVSTTFTPGTYSIVAKDKDGLTSASLTDEVGPIVIGSPTLTLPVNNQTNVALTPLLTWTNIPGSQGYVLQVSTVNPVNLSDPAAGLEAFFAIENSAISILEPPTTEARRRIQPGLLESETDYWWVAGAVDRMDDPDHIVLSTHAKFSTRTGVVEVDNTPPELIEVPHPVAQEQQSITLAWLTDEPSDSRVYFGRSASALSDSVVLQNMTTDHIVEIDRLTAGTEYFFAVASKDYAGNVMRAALPRGIRTATAADQSKPLFTLFPLVQVESDTRVSFYWRNNEATTASITLTSSAGDTTVSDLTAVPDHQIAINDLTAGTRYSWQITVADASGNTNSRSSERDIRTLDAPDNTRPVIILGPVVVPGQTNAVVNLTTDERTWARVDIIVGTGIRGEVVATRYSNTAARVHSISIPGLEANTAYKAMVYIEDVAGNVNSALRAVPFRTLETPDETAPEFLAIPTLSYLTNNLAELVWTTNELSDSYVALYQNGSSTPVFEITLGKLVRVHRVPLPNLTAGTAYDFYVESRDVAGNKVIFPTDGPPVGRTARGAGGRGTGSFTTSTQADVTPPVIVTPPSVLSRTASTITLSWETDEVANSVVYYGEAGTGRVARIVAENDLTSSVGLSDNVTTHTITLTGLSANTTYSYKVASTDPSGNGESTSDTGNTTTRSEEDRTAPQIVEGPEIAGQTDSRLTVRWVTDEPSNSQVSYTVHGTSKIAEDEEIPDITVPDLVTEHLITITNLTASTSYDVDVQSIDLNGNASTKTSLTGSTLAGADTDAPQISNGPNVVIDATQVYVSWNTNEASNSQIEYGLTQNFGQNASKPDLSTTHSIAVTGLTAATTYFFKISSADASGNVIDSLSTSLKWTTAAAPDTTAPDQIANVNVTEGAYEVRLTWDASADSGLAGYNVMRSENSGSFIAVANLLTMETFTDPEVTPGTAYSYYVTAQDNSARKNVSDPSATVNAAPALTKAPAAPTNPMTGNIQSDTRAPARPFLRVINSVAGVRATAEYTFIISPNDDLSSPVAVENNVVEGTDTTAWRVPIMLSHDSTYYWAAKAVDTEGFSGAFSTISSFVADTTLHPLDIKLSSFTAVAQRQVVQLEWAVTANSEEARFHVMRAIGDDGEYERITTDFVPASGSGFRFIDLNVITGQQYQYRLEAFNNLGLRTILGPVSVTAAVPTEVALDQNVPNPFNPTTTLAYQIPDAATVQLYVYNVLGQEVTRLVNTRLAGGFYRTSWDGRTSNGMAAGSGIYFARLVVTPDGNARAAETRVIRMTMIK